MLIMFTKYWDEFGISFQRKGPSARQVAKRGKPWAESIASSPVVAVHFGMMHFESFSQLLGVSQVLEDY